MTIHFLQNKRILITRTLEPDNSFCQHIRDAGGVLIIFPTIAIIAPPNPELLLQAIKKLDQTDIAIFISPNAVYYTMPLVQNYWTELPTSLQFAAVGSGTAKALEKYHINNSVYPPEEFGTEGLLALPLLQEVQNKHITIFKGVGGRELLSETLRLRGAVTTEAYAYQRVLPQINSNSFISIWQSTGIDIIICTSAESLQNLCALVGAEALPWLRQQQLLVSSSRLKDYAKSLGFVRTPLLANNASDEALLSELRLWRGTQNG